MQSAWPHPLLDSGLCFVHAGNAVSALFEKLFKHRGGTENDQVIFNLVLCDTLYENRSTDLVPCEK